MASDQKRPRVGLFGRLGSGNLGNDATLEALLGYLKAEHPGAVLECMCSGPDLVRQRYGLPATHLHWLHGRRKPVRWLPGPVVSAGRIAIGAVLDAWRTAAWVRRQDVVLVPGMGVLESTLPQRPWQLPYSMYLLSLFGRIFGTKVAFVSVGATVINQPVTHWLLTRAARMASYRSFRDEQSLEAAREMGIAHPRDEVYPDLVFALPILHPVSDPARTAGVGVGVMGYYGAPEERDNAEEIHAAYLETMKAFVRWLTETGHRVRLLIGDPADVPVVQAILGDVRTYWQGSADEPPPVTYEPIGSTEELIGKVAPLDAVVATRFHNVLIALRCAKPTVAIAYGHKHEALMTKMGIGELTQNIRHLDLEQLKKQFSALEAERTAITRTLANRNRSNRARLEGQFMDLSRLLQRSHDRDRSRFGGGAA